MIGHTHFYFSICLSGLPKEVKSKYKKITNYAFYKESKLEACPALEYIRANYKELKGIGYNYTSKPNFKNSGLVELEEGDFLKTIIQQIDL